MAALKLAKQSGARITKTSIMLGCGEQPHEVLHAFRTLRENGAALCPAVEPLFGYLVQSCSLQHWSCTSSLHVWHS